MTENAEKVRRHRHWFSGPWTHFGRYGPQDVHYHPCIEDGCNRVLIADGRDCGGHDQPHKRKTLP
jgi:hypothetical protein